MPERLKFSSPDPDDDADAAYDEFLVEEGLDLLAAYRAIKSKEARRALMVMAAAVAQAEIDAAETGG